MAEIAESDFVAEWQQAIRERTVGAAIEDIRRAEFSLANEAERYEATGNAVAAASASEAASQCRLAMDALRLAQQAAAE